MELPVAKCTVSKFVTGKQVQSFTVLCFNWKCTRTQSWLL